MGDLYLGLLLIAPLALGMFFAVQLLARRASACQRNALAVAIVALMAIYIHSVWQSTALARWLPLSNLIVLGNWFPLFLAALAGIVVEMKRLPLARRTAMLAILGTSAAYAAASPLLGTAPRCSDHWSRSGHCLQTTQFTCSAASAATLLRLHGIEATEQEMAELCLTRNGTSWQGLYRGLKLKTRDTAWDVEVIACTAAELPPIADRPLIAEVGLEAGKRVDPAFRSEFGWTSGMRHSVIIDGFSRHGRARIIDPSPLIGREDWDEETLGVLWRGHGLRLIPRP